MQYKFNIKYEKHAFFIRAGPQHRELESQSPQLS
jgi:hypothetical protein